MTRAKLVLEHADKMGCKRYLTAKDIIEGSPNLNLAFVAHIFQHRWEEALSQAINFDCFGFTSWIKGTQFNYHFVTCRNGLSTQTKQISFLETLPDDTQISREERAFRFWINSLGNSTYINNVFEDLRNGSVFNHWTKSLRLYAITISMLPYPNAFETI